MIGNIMDWIRRKLDPPDYTEKLAESDRIAVEKFMEVARYKHELEIMTGRRVELAWPLVERRKVPRDTK